MPRLAEAEPERQLIVVVSVPCRDFAAVLLGCGFVLSSRAPELDPPISVIRRLKKNVPVRIVADEDVIVDRFVRLHEGKDPFVELQGSKWLVSNIKAIVELTEMGQDLRSPRPRIGSIGEWAGIAVSWDKRLADPTTTLAIVGIKKWIREDIAVGIGRVGKSGAANTIEGLLVPKDDGVATCFTHLYSSSGLSEQLPFPKQVNAAILDGAGAIKFLSEIEVPVVFCVLDRSIADETAAELVVQMRNSRGEPCTLPEDIGRRLPAGVEVLAFTVAL